MRLSRGVIRSLERRAHGRLDSFRLVGGGRHYFRTKEAAAEVYVFTYHRRLGEEAPVPEVLRKVAQAEDVRRALTKVASEELLAEAIDLEALIDRREIVLLVAQPAVDFSEQPP